MLMKVVIELINNYSLHKPRNNRSNRYWPIVRKTTGSNSSSNNNNSNNSNNNNIIINNYR